MEGKEESELDDMHAPFTVYCVLFWFQPLILIQWLGFDLLSPLDLVRPKYFLNFSTLLLKTPLFFNSAPIFS